MVILPGNWYPFYQSDTTLETLVEFTGTPVDGNQPPVAVDYVASADVTVNSVNDVPTAKDKLPPATKGKLNMDYRKVRQLLAYQKSLIMIRK